MTRPTFQLGDRVAILNGVLAGERAIIVCNPESGQWFDRGDVWIRFDEDGKCYGREKGYAILSEQWYETSRLRHISAVLLLPQERDPEPHDH